MTETAALCAVLEEPLKMKEVQTGDLVFLHAPLDEQLPRMIVKYDQSQFSHVGIVVETGVMASSRTNQLSYERQPGEDFGGVRLNAIIDFRFRQPCIGRPRLTEEARIEAASSTLSFLEYGFGHRSGFSFVKLFIVAAALNAVREDKSAEARDAILSRAASAAELWAFPEQYRIRQQPTFFCSEAVSAAYPSERYTYQDFWTFPPSLGAEIFGPSVGDIPSFIRDLLAELGRHRPTDQQTRALKDLVSTLFHHDFAFLKETAKALLDAVDSRREGLAPPQVPARVPHANDPLPTSLVTPRMLCQANWLEWVRPLDFSTGDNAA